MMFRLPTEKGSAEPSTHGTFPIPRLRDASAGLVEARQICRQTAADVLAVGGRWGQSVAVMDEAKGATHADRSERSIDFARSPEQLQ
jgi:hypothetical protein